MALNVGLSRIPTEDLRRLFAAVVKGEMSTPVDVVELTRHGFQNHGGDLLDVLRGLDGVAVRAVLVAVLAERRG